MESIKNEAIEKVKELSSSFDVSYWRRIYSSRLFPEEYWNSIAKNGLFGFILDEKYGGMGRKFIELVHSTIIAARYYAGMGSYLFFSGALVGKLLEHCKDSLRNGLLRRICESGLKVSIAATEEGSGSNILSISTFAERHSNGYRITGSKMFVANADVADYIIVFAITSKEEGNKGITMFLVDADDKDIEKVKLEKVGMEFMNLFSLNINELDVSEDSIIGEIGDGWSVARSVFAMDRVLTSAALIGTANLALDTACKYATKRILSGKPIATNQAIQFPLADAAARLYGAEAFTLKAASIKPEERKFASYSNIALLLALESSWLAVDRAFQTLGGHAALIDYDLSRYWKDIRLMRLHPLPEEIICAIIAHKDLDLPKSY